MIQVEVNIFSSPLYVWWLKWLGLILALLVIAGLILLVRLARDFAWKWGRFERSDDLVKKNNLVKRRIAACAQWFYEHWGIVIIGGAIFLLVALVFVITELFGDRNFVNAMAIGTAIPVFLIFQLPRLLSPHIQIMPIEARHTKLTNLNRPKDIKRETCVDGQKKHVKAREIPAIKVNEYRERFLHIANTGINIYENWSIHLVFDPVIKVCPHWLEEKYKNHQHIQYRFQKTEKDAETIVYSPKSQYSLGPNQDLIIGFNVTVASEDIKRLGQENKCIRPLKLEISSSNRWGDTVKYFSWQVEE